MRKLNGIVIMPKQDLDEDLTEVSQQRNEFDRIVDRLTEARILDLILKGLSDEYEPIPFAAEREPEISLEEFETTMRNMHVNHVTRNDCWTFLRGKGRESAMMVSSGFKGI